MISKRLILKKPYKMAKEYTNDKIKELFNPCLEDSTTEFHALEIKEEALLVKRKTIKNNGLVIISMESEKSDILGTNVYITSSLVSSAIPNLCKTIYVDSKLMLFAYYDDPVVETIINELCRVSLFIIGIMKTSTVDDWKNMLKVYADSNIRYMEPGREKDHIPTGEKYIYISKDDLFCNPDEFDN